MSLISATLGRLLHGYKTVSQWAVIYCKIVDGRPICNKTRANRRGALNHILEALGDRTISSVRPHEVSAMIQRIAVSHPQTAKRVLFESSDLFNEAMNYGWIDRNPASSVKAPNLAMHRCRPALKTRENMRLPASMQYRLHCMSADHCLKDCIEPKASIPWCCSGTNTSR